MRLKIIKQLKIFIYLALTIQSASDNQSKLEEDLIVISKCFFKYVSTKFFTQNDISKQEEENFNQTLKMKEYVFSVSQDGTMPENFLFCLYKDIQNRFDFLKSDTAKKIVSKRINSLFKSIIKMSGFMIEKHNELFQDSIDISNLSTKPFIYKTYNGKTINYLIFENNLKILDEILKTIKDLMSMVRVKNLISIGSSSIIDCYIIDELKRFGMILFILEILGSNHHSNKKPNPDKFSIRVDYLTDDTFGTLLTNDRVGLDLFSLAETFIIQKEKDFDKMGEKWFKFTIFCGDINFDIIFEQFLSLVEKVTRQNKAYLENGNTLVWIDFLQRYGLHECDVSILGNAV